MDHIPPIALGVVAVFLALAYLIVYPMLVIDTMWGTEDAYGDRIRCGQWRDVPAEVSELTNLPGRAARECSLTTSFHEFHFWQLQLSSGGQTAKVPIKCRWSLRWTKLAGATVGLFLVWLVLWMGWCFLVGKLARNGGGQGTRRDERKRKRCQEPFADRQTPTNKGS